MTIEIRKDRRHHRHPLADEVSSRARLKTDFRAAQWLILAAFALALGSAIGWYLYSQHQSADSRERERLSTQAEVIEKNLAPQLLLANRVIEGILHDLPAWRSQNDGFKTANLRLQATNSVLEGIRPILIIDADGNVIASSNETLLGMNFIRREYFQTAIKDPDPRVLHISAPFRTVLDTFVISLFRTITGPNDEFAGIVLVSAVPEYFATLLDSVRYVPGVRTSIVHGDGKLFLSSPSVAGIQGMDLATPGSIFATNRKTGDRVGLIVGSVQTTGEERLLAYRTVQLAVPPMDKPLYIGVSRDTQSIFADWRKDAYLLGGMFGILLLVSSGGLFLYQKRQQEARGAERSRQAGEDQLRLFYEQDIVGLTITSPEKGWIQVNDYLCRMLGYSEQELRRMTWAQLTHPEDLAADVEQFDKLLAREIEGYRLEKRFITSTGEIVATNLVVRCHRKENGDIDFVMAMVEDISARKQIEAALTDSERRHRTLVEWTPEPIVVHRDRNIVYVNPAAIRMFGARSASDLIGTPILDRVQPEYLAIAMARLASFAERGLNAPMMEQKLLKLDGTVMDVEIQSTVIDYDGRPALHVSMRDITSRKAIEAELDAARLKSERASQAKSHFLASASHDLRQPAHALGMFVARLVELPNDARTMHLVGCIDACARAMQDMLDGFFDISRLDSEQTNLNRVVFPIEDLLEQLRGSFTNAARDKGIKLRIRSCPAWVESDRNLLHRILLNLVSNAVRYTLEGSILVACRPVYDGTQLRIQVRDSGVGIAAQHHEEIFREFFQVQNPERDRSKGLGVGLSIVDRACRLLNHPLAMRSAPGRGTCFTLTVPLAPVQERGTHEETRESIPTFQFEGLRVLLIEDDALGRLGLASLLTSWGCSVRTAEGAEAACDLYPKDQVPDITICDFRLGGGFDGIRAVDMLSEIAGRRIVACLVSGDTDANVRQRAQDAGLTLLQKPVRPAKLRSLIRHLVLASRVQPLSSD